MSTESPSSSGSGVPRRRAGETADPTPEASPFARAFLEAAGVVLGQMGREWTPEEVGMQFSKLAALVGLALAGEADEPPGSDGEEALLLLARFMEETMGCRVSMELETPLQGSLRVHHCPLWEQGFRPVGLPCEETCHAMLSAVLECVSPGGRVEHRFSQSRGNPECDIGVAVAPSPDALLGG